MFKYDNRAKNAISHKIIEKLKQTHHIIISQQSAGRIEYLIKQRQLLVDSVEVSGKEVGSERSLQLILDLKSLIQIINQ